MLTRSEYSLRDAQADIRSERRQAEARRWSAAVLIVLAWAILCGCMSEDDTLDLPAALHTLDRGAVVVPVPLMMPSEGERRWAS